MSQQGNKLCVCVWSHSAFWNTGSQVRFHLPLIIEADRQLLTAAERIKHHVRNPFIFRPDPKEKKNTSKGPPDKHNHQIPVDVPVYLATRRDKDLSEFHKVRFFNNKQLGVSISSEKFFAQICASRLRRASLGLMSWWCWHPWSVRLELICYEDMLIQ